MLLRDPNAFAPILGTDQYLLLGSDAAENRRQISKFSQQDAEVCSILVCIINQIFYVFHIRITLLQRFEEYELWMEKIGKIGASTFSFLSLLSRFSADAITPLLDNSPINVHKMFSGSFSDRLRSLKSLPSFFKMGEPDTEYNTALSCRLSLQ